ncbi:hypothetical protein ABNIH1_04117 [Acinetobacter baumannii ABNIH1]|nr:hypothetical protein ABNIH1_04117 [Acinetobacter baumannii ABNIH1]
MIVSPHQLQHLDEQVAEFLAHVDLEQYLKLLNVE